MRELQFSTLTLAETPAQPEATVVIRSLAPNLGGDPLCSQRRLWPKDHGGNRKLEENKTSIQERKLINWHLGL